MKPFHYYVKKAETNLTFYKLCHNLKTSEVAAILWSELKLELYAESHDQTKAEYCEAFSAMMESLDHPDFADREVAKTIRANIRMADIVYTFENEPKFKQLLEQ